MSVHIPTNDGRWVNQNFVYLAEILRDYDPRLELVWIPPEKRKEPEDHKRAYAIVHHVDSGSYVAMYAGETDDPQQILARIFTGDRKKNDVLAVLDAQERAAELFRLKQEIEIREELAEHTAWLMKTDKNYITHRLPFTNEKVKFDDHLRRVN